MTCLKLGHLQEYKIQRPVHEVKVTLRLIEVYATDRKGEPF
jgi:hypothetical protein